jgi:hypothetical protein
MVFANIQKPEKELPAFSIESVAGRRKYQLREIYLPLT